MILPPMILPTTRLQDPMTNKHQHAAPNAEFTAALRAAVRGEVYDDAMSRGLHATDASHYQMVPAAVVVPRDEADCVAAVQVAARFGVPITPRGGATSLSGQTFGTGLVLDVSKYLDQVLELNVAERWVRVQPGLIRDVLNAQLAPHGLHFAPDPATGNRATIGGMIGNNASGMRSIVYGKTIDHVLACKVVLSRRHACWNWTRRTPTSGSGGRRATRARRRSTAASRRSSNATARKSWPAIPRSCGGSRATTWTSSSTGPATPARSAAAIWPGTRTWNLSNLIVGSEGTLGLLLEAKLRLTPLPRATALAIVHFPTRSKSLRAVPAILRASARAPSNCWTTWSCASPWRTPPRRNLATFLEGQPQAVLLIEVFGDGRGRGGTRDRGPGGRPPPPRDRLRLAGPHRHEGPGRRLGRAEDWAWA